MKKLTALLLSLLCSTTVAETTLYFNVNGYTLDRDFQLLRFSAIQFTDDRIDAIYDDLVGTVSTVSEALQEPFPWDFSE